MFAYYKEEVMSCDIDALAHLVIGRREVLKYSQRDLASKAGISNSTVSRIEKGSEAKNPICPDPPTLKKIADALYIEYMIVLETIGYIPKDWRERAKVV